LAAEEPKIKSIIDDLNERTKELHCVYAVDELLKDISASLDNVFIRLTEIIPTGWRYSGICRVLIQCEGKDYASEGLVKTDLKQVAKILLEDQVIGEIQVFYIKPLKLDKGVFLPEEQRLINTIAKKIGNFILYKKLRETISTLNKGEKPAGTELLNTATQGLKWLVDFGLTNDEIARMTKVQIKFRKGETICKQGAISSYIMLLTEGHVKAYLEGIMDRTYNLAIIKAFDLIAISSLYGKGYYHFSATALTPATLYLIDKEIFTDILKNNSVFASHVMKYFCENFELAFHRLSTLAFKQSLGRVAEVLIYLSEEIFEDNLIQPTITRKDIAELAGISTENAVRILSELKNDNIINIHSRGIEILNPSLLKTFSIAG
jgi:CRP/FNR family transcriptional regulator